MDPYIGEIRLWCGVWAPYGWYFCQGQQLSINQYTALYSIIGLNFGGDGRTVFNLPDLRSRVPIHQGQGPGLTNRVYADADGEDTVQLVLSQMANHTHLFNAATLAGTETTPVGNIWAPIPGRGSNIPKVYAPPTGVPASVMNPMAIQPAGGSSTGTLAHNNQQPYLVLNYMIAWDGIYPVKQ